MTEQEEVWKEVDGCEGRYKVSNTGRVISVERQVGYQKFKEKEKSYKKSRFGYVEVQLYYEGKVKKIVSVHRLVAAAFIKNPQNKPQVNHINGIKSDNKVHNLEWNTNGENSKHAFQTGLKRKIFGLEHHATKPILDTNTGVFYETVKEAAIAKNMSASGLRKIFLGYTKKNRTGLIVV